MATGIGIAAMADPDDSSKRIGRTPLDDRLIQAGLRTNGVLQWGGITPSTTAMAYTVSGGFVVQIGMGSGQGSVLGAPSGQVLTTYDDGSALAVGGAQNRIDVIYVKQNDNDQGDGSVEMKFYVQKGVEGSTSTLPTLPPRSLVIEQRMVLPTTTKASQTTVVASRQYSVGLDGTKGVLHQWTDQFNGLADQGSRVLGNGTIVLSTDRNIDFEIIPCISAATTQNSGSCLYGVILDDVTIAACEIAYTGYWGVTYWKYPTTLEAGTHTVAYVRVKRAGDDFYQHYGSQQGYPWPGTIFRVVDRGITQ